MPGAVSFCAQPAYTRFMSAPSFDIFLVVAPGLEPLLADEARAHGFEVRETIPGGVTIVGGWPDVWRANLLLRGATRVLVRLASFRAMHLAQLDKRSKKLPWTDWLRADMPVRVEATCRRSRIYHNKAAAQRIEGALSTAKIPLSKDATLVLKVRIDDDLCTISVDTSGESLHKRGLKEQVNKAPMRETLAALFLRACRYNGTEPVYDPMCGSGTFVIEAAEKAAGLAPGRVRSFAFENLASFEPDTWQRMRDSVVPQQTSLKFTGSDRDQGAVRMSEANAARAGVSNITQFTCAPIGEAVPPEGPPGLVIVNPPYGGRIGNKAPLHGLYAAFGNRITEAFKGWRVGLVTSEPGLARATGLKWKDTGPIVDHGGTKVRLYQTGPL